MVHIEGKDDRMVANNLEPHYLTHPGEVIKDELEFRGISQRHLAWGLSCQVVSALRSYSFMGIYFVVSHFFPNFAAVIIL